MFVSTVGSSEVTSSGGSVDKPPAATVSSYGGVEGLHNPLDWDSVPSMLQAKFPHWKESAPASPNTQSQASNQDSEQAYSCYKTTQQPEYSFPYVVMENDTLNSIAVKFDTTPAELARLNRKPLGATSTVFTGEVLYIPDQDEIARSAPKSAPPQLDLNTSDNFASSAESEGTIRSSSMSQPPPEAVPQLEEVAEFGEEAEEGESSVVFQQDEYFEEVTEDHMVLVARYISDDQGCAHGNLMLNHTAMMFTPFPNQPLVKEHGAANFEIMIPLQDIVFAAFTRDVASPQSKRTLKSPVEDAGQTVSTNGGLESAEKEEGRKGISEEQDGEAERKPEPLDGDKNREQVLDDKQSELSGSEERRDEGGAQSSESKEDERGCADESEHSQIADRTDAKAEEQLKPSDSNIGRQTLSPGRVSNSDSQVSSSGSDGLLGGHKRQPSGVDEMLAIMGAGSAGKLSSHNTSESSSSVDNPLSEHPCFLHVRVSQKCSATHTYTPLNRAVGVDIPHQLASPKGTLQQVKTAFCFAVAEIRINDIVSFISKHRPAEQEFNRSVSPCSWLDGSYEFISYDSLTALEDLNFSENYFKGAESSESWEVYSLKDVPRYRRRIDRMEVESDLPLPVLSETSSLMQETHLRALANHSLSAAVGHDWFLIYSTFKHGISLRTLYRNMANCDLPESPVVLLVRDEQHKLFGAALTSLLKQSEKFYGTGESYLFTFESPTDIRIFHWTGENNYIVKGSLESVCVGCEDGHSGLWLDETLLSGSSEQCSTFGNTCLSSKPEFICTGVEAWGFL